MKKITLSVIVLTLTTLLMGALIGGAYALTQPVIDKNQHKVLVEAAQGIYEGSDTFFYVKDVEKQEGYQQVKESYKGLSEEQQKQVEDILLVYQGDEFKGLIYIEEGQNQYGSIKLAVSISADNQLSVKAVNFEQTPGFGDKAKTKFEDELRNVPLDTKIDAQAGATFSSTLLQKLIDQALERHQANAEAIEALGVISTDPLIEIYGKGYSKTKDETFEAGEIVTEKYLIEGPDGKGMSLVGSKEALFKTEYGNVSGKITLEVYLNEAKEVVYFEFLEYGHSEGKFKNIVEAHLEALKGTKLADYEKTLAEMEKPFAGATKTGTLAVKPILEEMADKLDELKAIYGKDYSKAKDEAFTPTEKVLEKYSITGTPNGSSYVGAYSRKFKTAYADVSGEIRLELYLDEIGKIVKIDILNYEHSKGDFKVKVSKYLSKFIGTQITDLEATHAANKGLYAGATETAEKTVYQILLAIKEVHAK